MKFIHLADVHLGASPDRGSAWNKRREEEIWETFRRVIAEIRENPVDLLFIAGDLFHRQPLLRELKEVNALFASIPETRIYLIAGNHDYIRKDSLYRTFRWAENVCFFREEKVTSVKDPVCDVTVYGFSFLHQEIEREVLFGVVPEESEGLHILLAHGGDERHVPVNYRSLSAAGFDYVALGHIHRPNMPARDQIRFSGALEPLDRNDTGPHGYVEGQIIRGRLRTRFVPFACRSYLDLAVKLDEETTQYSLEEQLKQEIREQGPDNLYRVLLTGERSPELILIPERLKGLGNITELRDDSHPAYDLEVLYRQYSGTLVGDYIHHFLQLPERTAVEEKALYYGLQALLETGRF